MGSHPSRLELDRASVRAGSESTAQHLADCAECKAYVARVQEAPPIPAWLHSVPPRKRRSLFAWLKLPALAGGLALAGAAAALLIVARPADYQGEKGNPAVALYYKRDGAISLWTPGTALRQGDQLQLKLDPLGYRHAAVAEVAADGVKPLWSAALAGQTEVPTSWTLDDAPGAETLLVAFSQDELTAAELAQAARELPRTAKLWAVQLVLLKEQRK